MKKDSFLNNEKQKLWKPTVIVTVLSLLIMGLVPALAYEQDPHITASLSHESTGDLTHNTALSIARDVCQIAIGKTDLTGSSSYFMSTFIKVYHNGEQSNAWSFTLTSREDEHDKYIVTVLSPSGEIFASSSFSRVNQLKLWEEALGPQGSWLQETQELFYNLYEKGPMDVIVKGQPGKDMITKDHAISTAIQELTNTYNVDEKVLGGLDCGAFFYKIKEVTPLYNSDFWIITFNEREDTRYQVSISGLDGSILMVVQDDVILYERQGYTNPKASELNVIDAREKANAALIDQFGVNPLELTKYAVHVQYVPGNDDSSTPYGANMWMITYREKDDALVDQPSGYHMCISADDGTVLVLYNGDEEIYRSQ